MTVGHDSHLLIIATSRDDDLRPTTALKDAYR